jgi:hypothetical protein
VRPRLVRLNLKEEPMAAAHSTGRLLSIFAAGALLATGATASAQPPPPPPPADTAPSGEPLPPPPPPPPPASEPPLAGPPVAAPSAPAASGAPGGLKIAGTNATAKVGFLLQPAFESVGGPAKGSTSMSNNLYVRRARLMVGMTVGSDFELFAETDTPNLNRQVSPGVTPTPLGAPGAFIQDAFMTWKPMDEFKLDFGMMLVPFSHNGLQGATTLYGLEYFKYSFQQSGAFGNFVGRDTGIQARGIIAKHLEYRLGAFEGKRAPAAGTKVAGRNAPRVMARLQFNLFDAETGYFYAGTYSGTKKVVSIGGGWDHQDDYNAFAGDVFIDWPIVGEDVVTAQFNYTHLDGKTWQPFTPAMPMAMPPTAASGIAKQDNIMAEAGYRIGILKLSPIFRFELNKPATGMGSKTTNIGGGLAYWYMNHNANVKVFFMNIKTDVATQKAWNQLIVQTQFFVF